MPWLTISIDTNSFCFTKEIETIYNNSKFIWRPGTEELFPTISIELPDMYQYIENHHKIYHEKLKIFLSIFCYTNNCGIREVSWGCAPNIQEMGKDKAVIINDSYNFNNLLNITNEKKLRAIALFREVKSINHDTYKFLGFFKIININYNNRNEQIGWINENINKLSNPAKIRLQELHQDSICNIGEYLYENGRCAIAHAYSNPVINPDLVDDLLQIKRDLPLIENLAKIMINNELENS